MTGREELLDGEEAFDDPLVRHHPLHALVFRGMLRGIAARATR